jgi:hypothetical protein
MDANPNQKVPRFANVFTSAANMFRDHCRSFASQGLNVAVISNIFFARCTLSLTSF